MLGSRQLLPRSRSSSPQGSPVRSGSASLLLSLLRPGHQPWACGCTPWRARDCRVPRRARPHAPARACGAMGREGRGLRPERAWAGRGPGSASRCAGCAGAPGRLRGPGSSALRLLAPAGLLDFALLPSFASLAEDLTAQAARFFFFSRDGHPQVGHGNVCLNVPATQEAEAGESFGSSSLETTRET